MREHRSKTLRAESGKAKVGSKFNTARNSEKTLSEWQKCGKDKTSSAIENTYCLSLPSSWQGISEN